MKPVFAATLILLLGLALAPAPAGADPSERCESRKLTSTGRYATCRLHARARALRAGVAPDYSVCEARFHANFARTERLSGSGVCPTEDDAAAIAEEVEAGTDELAEQLMAPEPACPAGYRDRSTYQVVQDYVAAYDAEDYAALACLYHPDAFVIDDQGILVGRTEIIAVATSLNDLFDGVDLDVIQTDAFRDTGRLLYGLDGGWIVVEDGADSFVVKRGQIRKHVRHNLITFTGPPPSQQ